MTYRRGLVGWPKQIQHLNIHNGEICYFLLGSLHEAQISVAGSEASISPVHDKHKFPSVQDELFHWHETEITECLFPYVSHKNRGRQKFPGTVIKYNHTSLRNCCLRKNFDFESVLSASRFLLFEVLKKYGNTIDNFRSTIAQCCVVLSIITLSTCKDWCILTKPIRNQSFPLGSNFAEMYGCI